MQRLLIPIVVAALATVSSAQTKLLRFPDVHRERVAFCYAGDLWTAPSSGGTATRLTAHEGLELFPRFSPDGAWIAFTGQYDGDEQVYVIPAAGGVPKQLTWYPSRGPLTPRWGYDHQVYGWSKDGARVLFRSMREGWDLTDTRLFFVPAEGGPSTALPMPVSGGGDLSPDEKHVVYSPLTRDFRTWKRYEGGWAQDLYIFHMEDSSLEPVAHSPRTERDPMWIGDTIYFSSDRTGTLNLFSYDVKGHRIEQLTKSSDFDVRWPSKGESGEIVFEHGGELVLFDTKSKRETRISITVPNDGVAMRPSRIPVADDIEGFELSPKGERALFVARGDVFSAPIEKGPTRNLTESSGVHDRSAVWSPDGASIAFLSDRTGEEEIWRVAQDGSGMPEQLTNDGTVRRSGLRYSPDGKHIAFSDASGRVWVFTIESKTMREVAADMGGTVGDYTWAPDSAWLALSLSDGNELRSIWIWSAADGALSRVTGELWNEYEPVWDPAGKYLYYLSDREFAPQLSQLEWNYAVNRPTQIFALALRKDVAHPFPPQSDEVGVGEAAEKEAGAAKDESKEDDGEDEASAPTPVAIDLEGLAERVARVPMGADNYNGLNANAGHLFVLKNAAGYFGRDGERETELVLFSLEDREETSLASGVNRYAISQDGKKLLVAKDDGHQLLEASAKGKDDAKSVSTDGLVLDRVPTAEWSEVFVEVWRRFRDYFYAPNLHGYDWIALRKQYEELLPHVAHRSDLNYVLGEMVAELNVGHAYVSGGDWVSPDRHPVGLLGAIFALDPVSGRFRIARILPGQNEEDRYRSPLTEIGVDVKAGEYLLAIDGEELAANDDPYRWLRDKADRPIELSVGATPDPANARKVTVRPITSETDLYYLEWVLGRRAIVERLSNGRLGYIHLPDMGADGIREFIKWYYGQVGKEGLVVDDRNNGGGNVSQMILERLARTLLGTEYARHSRITGTYPDVVFHGPMVCLLNENSASDGDIFPWMFKEKGLGPLIGKRSWGGVVGITDHGPLIDGGTVNVPEFGHADENGQWAVEGHGVDPDIVVENDPRSVLEGRDPQLERGIAELMALIGPTAKALPSRPADPVKTK